MAGGGRPSVGERAADFVLSDRSGVPSRFYAHAGGRPTVVVFGDSDDPRLADLAGRLAGREDVALCCVSPQGPQGPPGRGDYPMWSDPQGGVAAAYGVAVGQLTAIVLDPNLRVIGVVAGESVAGGSVAGESLAGEVVGLLDGAVNDGAVNDGAERDGVAADVVSQAPVLFVPRALDAPYRDHLIRVWESEGALETGVAGSSGEFLDATVKRRRDHTVRDPELLRRLSAVVGRSVLPEVRKAFAFRANRFEGFKIACYDAATGGFFRAHRDNLTPATAHRVFALTLNLNDGYEGGQLRFPEYGHHLYRPGAGTALVFSCAHLHEVLDVTAGRRFVLLSFLYAGSSAGSSAGSPAGPGGGPTAGPDGGPTARDVSME